MKVRVLVTVDVEHHQWPAPEGANLAVLVQQEVGIRLSGMPGKVAIGLDGRTHRRELPKMSADSPDLMTAAKLSELVGAPEGNHARTARRLQVEPVAQGPKGALLYPRDEVIRAIRGRFSQS